MATAPKKKVLDKNGDQFFPITHINAVIDGQGSNVETIISNKQDTLVSGTNIKTINNTSLLGSGNIDIQGGGSTEITEGTWSEIKALRDNSQLNPGSWYRITDYVLITNPYVNNISSAGYQFDIIVLATASNNFSEEARAALHSGDTYFANSELQSWKIWYCIDNDTDRFSWAYASGKGVIYRLVDEYNNDCPYDFKNMLFQVTATWLNDDGASWRNYVLNTSSVSSDLWFYTFSFIDEGVIVDSFIKAAKRDLYIIGGGSNYIEATTTLIQSYIIGYALQRNIFVDSDPGQTFSLSAFNHISKGCYDNLFGRTYSLYFAAGCESNYLCHTSVVKFGESCRYNKSSGLCNNITFGFSCEGNDLSESCSNIKLGNQCCNNGISGTSITFGNSCQNNLTYSTDSLTLGNNCSYISTSWASGDFGDGITIGNSCHDISLPFGAKNISIGNGCHHIGYFDSGSSAIGSNFDGIRIDNGCQYIRFGGGSCWGVVVLSSASGYVYNSTAYYLDIVVDWPSHETIIYGEGSSNTGVDYLKIKDILVNSQNAGNVYAAPSGSSGTAYFRKLAASDLPTNIQFASLPEEKRPLTFEILTAGTITWKHTGSSQTIQYSRNGDNWIGLASTTSGNSISVSAGDTVVFKGSAWPGSSQTIYRTFGGTATFEAYGNPASLRYGTSLTGTESLANYCLEQLFRGCSGLKRAPVLPATTLYTYCYWYMFANCTSLEEAPLLPATTLTGGCYSYMFYNCTNLKYVKCLATSGVMSSVTDTNSSNWLSGVASSGVLEHPSGVEYSVAAFGVPSGWVEKVNGQIIIPSSVNWDSFNTNGTEYTTKSAAVTASGFSETMFDAILNGEYAGACLKYKTSSVTAVAAYMGTYSFSNGKSALWLTGYGPHNLFDVGILYDASTGYYYLYGAAGGGLA